MRDSSVKTKFSDKKYEIKNLENYLKDVLSLESVACKDWLTNKVDRCVALERFAKQQCVGSLQLPLNNCGVMALDYSNLNGVTTLNWSFTFMFINRSCCRFKNCYC